MKSIVLCLFLAFLSGCASYSQSFHKVESLLVQQKPAEALLELEKKPQTGKNRLLYLLDKAMLQRMSGLYSQSNVSFEKAKLLIDKLDATSLVEQVGAVSINDNMMSYEGEDYEQVAVHLYEALNYIKLGLWDEARVEALQVDVRLKSIAEDNEVEFEEDAFSRYLTGMIYEHGGEWSDAMIAYRKAYQIYKKQQQSIPVFLKHDLLRLSKQQGLHDEYQMYQKTFAMHETLSAKALSTQGEVIFLLHHSLAPIKRSHDVLVWGDKNIRYRISLPVYQSRPSFVVKARLIVGGSLVETNIVHDFDKSARLSLKRHMPAMTARLIARAILKKTAAKAAEKRGGDLAGFLVDVASMVTETADTRSWLTLPKNIHFARLPVKKGVFTAKIELLDQYGQKIGVIPLADIEIKGGEKIVIEKTWLALPQQTP